MRTHTCPSDHKHGETPTCYRSHKCACSTCREANTKRCYERKKLIAYGRPTSDLVPATETRAHIGELAMAGMLPTAIAAAAGFDRSTIARIMRGPKAMVFAETAAKILAIPEDLTVVPDAHRIDSRGARRRLQALGAHGWATATLAGMLGLSRHTLDRIHRSPFIAANTHRAIVDLFDQIWDKEPPTTTRAQRAARTIALQAARAAGWLPALAWDDIDMDDSPAEAEADPDLIDEVAVALALNGAHVHLNDAERAIVIARAPEAGLSQKAIAPIVGITARHVGRLRKVA